MSSTTQRNPEKAGGQGQGKGPKGQGQTKECKFGDACKFVETGKCRFTHSGGGPSGGGGATHQKKGGGKQNSIAILEQQFKDFVAQKEAAQDVQREKEREAKETENARKSVQVIRDRLSCFANFANTLVARSEKEFVSHNHSGPQDYDDDLGTRDLPFLIASVKVSDTAKEFSRWCSESTSYSDKAVTDTLSTWVSWDPARPINPEKREYAQWALNLTDMRPERMRASELKYPEIIGNVDYYHSADREGTETHTVGIRRLSSFTLTVLIISGLMMSVLASMMPGGPKVCPQVWERTYFAMLLGLLPSAVMIVVVYMIHAVRFATKYGVVACFWCLVDEPLTVQGKTMVGSARVGLTSAHHVLSGVVYGQCPNVDVVERLNALVEQVDSKHRLHYSTQSNVCDWELTNMTRELLGVMVCDPLINQRTLDLGFRRGRALGAARATHNL